MTDQRNVVIATLAAGIAFLTNFAFQIVAGRYLGAAAYSLLSVLLVGISTAAVAFSGLQFVVTRELVSHPNESHAKHPLDRLSKTALLLAMAIALLIVLASGQVAHLFATGREVIWLVAASVPSAALLAIVNGRYQGSHRIERISILSAGLSTAKLLLASLVLVIGFGVTAVMITLVASTTLLVVIAFWTSREPAPQAGNHDAWAYERDSCASSRRFRLLARRQCWARGQFVRSSATNILVRSRCYRFSPSPHSHSS